MPLFFIYTDFLKAHNVSVNKQHMNLNIPMKTFSNHLSKESLFSIIEKIFKRRELYGEVSC